MEKFPCDSSYGPTSDGCCADGRRCDELCIASIAFQECKQARHASANGSEGPNNRCWEETAKSGREAELQICDQQLSCRERMPRSADYKGLCRSKITSHRCIDDGEADQVNSRASASLTNANCCNSKSGAVIGPGFDISSRENGDQDGSSESQCCSKISARGDQQADLGPTQSAACCRTRDSMPLTSTKLSKNLDDNRESYGGCSLHLAQAMNQYKTFLEAGLCICRDAMKQLDVCCSKTTGNAITKKHRAFSTTTSCHSSRDAPNDSHKYAGSGAADGQNRCKVYKVIDDRCCSITKSVGETGCSDSKSPTDLIQSCSAPGDSCCSGLKNSCNTRDPSDAPCGPPVHQNVKPTKPLDSSAATSGIPDLEQSAAREHVTFSITGLTCTGCVKKVLGVLSNVNGVENAQVNFIAAIGDFDVDATKITAPTALRRLEQETGFNCLRVVSDHQILDLNMTLTAAQQFTANLPKGVDSVEKVGKEVYRVSYNPCLIGARTVLTASTGRIAPPSNDGATSDSRRRAMRMLLSFFGATVFTIPVGVLAFASLPISPLTKGIVELVLATFVQLIAVPEFYMPALKALVFSKTVEMDMLVVISITAAYGYSIVAFGLEVAGIDLEQGTLFETSTLLITLVLLGRLIASYAKVKAVHAVSLRSLQIETALLEDINRNTTKIDSRLLELHDIVRVPAHSKIVSDGEVIDGQSTVDESMLTGESLPVSKVVGDTVTAGTLNNTGVLRVKLTRLPGKNSITDIADLVQNALNSKPRIQDVADVVAGYFVPIVVSLAVIVLAVWIAVALRIRNQNIGGAIGTAITYAIAVLAISCPCALGLAVPMVLVIAGAAAARSGVIIKQAGAMERGFKVTDVIFDKTGTLTTSQLEVMQLVIAESSLSKEQVLAIAYSLVKDDNHPVARAVATELAGQDISMEAVQEIETIPGCGVQAIWQGQQAKAGNPYWLGVDASASVKALQVKDYTLLCVTFGQQLLVSFGLKAVMRPEAQAVVDALHNRGLTCHILSGDQPTSVSNVASSLGIPIENVASRQSPANKRAYIENLKSAGRTTLFVGDGTNDAVAVAAADVGVQIGAASDVTRAIAAVVLLGGLEGIITLLEVSRQSFYRIVFNFLWAGVYNVFAIALASGAFVKVRVAPRYAGLGEIVSVLPVVFAALTMSKVKTKML